MITVLLVLIQSVPKLNVWLPLDYMFCRRNCLLDHVGLLTLAGAITEITVRIVYPAVEPTDLSVKVFEFSGGIIYPSLKDVL